jgi:hypothetical protein
MTSEMGTYIAPAAGVTDQRKGRVAPLIAKTKWAMARPLADAQVFA